MLQNDLIKTSVTGANRVNRWLKAKAADAEKAMNTAIRVEAYRMSWQLKKDLQRGAPGGRSVKPLSYIARRIWRNPNRKALSKMARGVRYSVAKQHPFTMAVGFIDHKAGGGGLSKAWQWLGKFHQEGGDLDISERQRFFIIRRGAELGTVEGGSTPFFLKKTTRIFHTPARPIIDPFWQANRKKAMGNIQKNFRRKLKGERI